MKGEPRLQVKGIVHPKNKIVIYSPHLIPNPDFPLRNIQIYVFFFGLYNGGQG